MIDISNFKVVYGDRVLNALVIIFWQFPEEQYQFEKRETILKAKFLEVLALNEEGNVISIYDEAWRFQFLPKVRTGGTT